jgi:hypothetical protein
MVQASKDAHPPHLTSSLQDLAGVSMGFQLYDGLVLVTHNDPDAGDARSLLGRIDFRAKCAEVSFDSWE